MRAIGAGEVRDPWDLLQPVDDLSIVVQALYPERDLDPFAVRYADEVACIDVVSGEILVLDVVNRSPAIDTFKNADAFLLDMYAAIADHDAGEFKAMMAAKDEGPRNGIGFDLGGVVLDSPGGSVPLDSWPIREVPGAVDTIRWMHRVGDWPSGVHVISRCGPDVEAWSRHALDHVNFFERTGLSQGHVHFVRKVGEKVDLAVQLQLTHFVDDRSDVLARMAGRIPNRLHLAGSAARPTPSGAIRVQSMDDVRVAVGTPLPNRLMEGRSGPQLGRGC